MVKIIVRILFITVLIISMGRVVLANQLSKTTLQIGTGINKINIIFIPSGYTPAQAVDFESEVNNNLIRLWQNNFFAAYPQRFDIYRVDNQYDSDGLLKTDAEVENLIDSDTDCGGKGFGDSGSVTCIHIVIDNESGGNETRVNHIRLKNTADDQYSLAHEIGLHVLGNHRKYDPLSSGPVMKDGYACGSYTYSYLYSNVYDKNSAEKWSDLVNTAVACGNFYLPSDTVTDYNSSYQNFSNVGYKAAQIGFAKRTQDSLKYAALGTDFSGTKQYGQDNTPPAVTVDGIQSGQVCHWPISITVNASDSQTGIDRVEFYLSVDGAEYKSIGVDRTSYYTQYLNFRDFPGTTYSVRVYVFDEAWNYSLNQYDNLSFSLDPVNDGFQHIGKGSTTAYYIDCDGDGYGVGTGYVFGSDADDNDPEINTTASVEVKYGSITQWPDIIQNLKIFFSTCKGYNNIQDIYFVAADGDNNTGVKNDITRPFANLGIDKNEGVRKAGLKAGDLVLYRGGKYTDDHTTLCISGDIPNGTADKPIIIMSFPGELAVLASNNDSHYNKISIGGKKHYIIDTFQCGIETPTASGGLYSDPGTGMDHITIRNVEFLNNWQATRCQYRVSNTLLENCVMHDNTGGGAHLNYWGGPWCFNQTFKNCIFYANRTTYPLFQWNGFGTNLRWEGCTFHSAGQNSLNFLYGIYNSTIINNTFFNNNGHDIRFGRCDASYYPYGVPENNKIINNTFWRGNHLNKYAGSGAVWSPADNSSIGLFNSGDPDPIRGNSFINNVWYSYGSSVFQTEKIGTFEASEFFNNVIYCQKGDIVAALGLETKIPSASYRFSEFESTFLAFKDNKYADLLFKDVSTNYYNNPERFNFDLTAGSPAIDFGINSSDVPFIDRRENSRIGNPDAGCYEYLSFPAPESPSVPETFPQITIELKDSSGNGLADAQVQVEQLGWETVGKTDAQGKITVLLEVPCSYTPDLDNNLSGKIIPILVPYSHIAVRVIYKGVTSQVIVQDINKNQVFTFQTVKTAVMLKTSSGQVLPGGRVTYIWGVSSRQTLGTTGTDGTITGELLPGCTYTFRMEYTDAWMDIAQDISSNPNVVFHTQKIKVCLRDSNGTGLGNGKATYSWAGAGVRRTIGFTGAIGEVTAELLPSSYSFRMEYTGVVFKDIYQDIRNNPDDVVFIIPGSPTPISGDVNGDEKIDILDLQLCINVPLGTETTPKIVSRADINGDGSVNVLDVQAIINKILGG